MARAGASDSEDDLAAAAATGGHSWYSTQHCASRANLLAGTRKTSKSKPTMQKSTAAKTAPKRKAAAPKQRQPLKDRTNEQSEDEGDDAYDEGEVAKPKAKRARTTAARKPRAAKAAETLGVIPETQPDPAQVEDVEQSIEMDPENMDITQAPTPKQVQRFVQRARSTSVQPVQPLQPYPSARSASLQPAPPLQPRPSARSMTAQPGYPAARERSGSVSGTERERRGGDPELRRKLNDLTKKHENLNLKYQNLQEIGRSNAETNFEKLKRATDQKAKDANDLVAALKKENAELRKATSSTNSETSGLQKQVKDLTNSKEKLSAEAAGLNEKVQTGQNEVKSVNAALQTAQNEIKSLEAKLVAARQQVSNSTQESKVSASASNNLKGSVSANTSDAQKEAKMKENLYSDLTGLIIRGVKRKEGEDEYDCIQTGRNGSKFCPSRIIRRVVTDMRIVALHFHLSVANESGVANPRTPSGLSYEETEFAYEPFLDESRDRDLLDLLPDYLTEEIVFPRTHAVKFYTKVIDSMTKKVVVDEEES